MFANLNTDPGNETSASWELGDLSHTRVSSTCPNLIGIKEAHAVKNVSAATCCSPSARLAQCEP